MAAKAIMKTKICFFAILTPVLLVFCLKLIFLIARYGMTTSSVQCVEKNLTAILESRVSHEFIFTIIVYTVLSVLQFIEYLLLGRQFYLFFFKQEEIKDFLKKHSKRYLYMILFSAILVPYFLLGFVIPGLGIYQEVVFAEQLGICSGHYLHCVLCHKFSSLHVCIYRPHYDDLLHPFLE